MKSLLIALQLILLSITAADLEVTTRTTALAKEDGVNEIMDGVMYIAGNNFSSKLLNTIQGDLTIVWKGDEGYRYQLYHDHKIASKESFLAHEARVKKEAEKQNVDFSRGKLIKT